MRGNTTDRDETRPDIMIRNARIGDHGIVVSQQAALYHAEYGWDSTYEALAAEIVAGFIRDHDPARERCFIADCDGEVVGALYVMRKDDETAKIRLVHVSSAMRGRGLGKRLIDEALCFARSAGYRRMTLWTNSCLMDARRLYERAGFVLVGENAHVSFGHALTGQTFERDL